LLLVRTQAERSPGEPGALVIDDTPPAELVARIFAADSVVVSGEPPTRVLDLTGEVCPFTFVRTKLALEEMPVGARLLVRVDFPPAAKNVPRSAREWGQEIGGVARSGERHWDIWITRR
jgi:TusA-related sulfurtransferase